jgi:multidrug resistance efflux pump
MVLALLITVGYVFLLWLIFFRFKLIQFSITWAVVSAFIGIHVLLIFLIGLRFVTPYSTDARVIQHTIQLIPRLPEPTLVTAVLVAPDTPVSKGQPLFQFDRRPYEYKVRQLEAQLAAALQNVRVMKADCDVATQKVVQARSDLAFATDQQQRAATLAQRGAGPVEDAQKWAAKLQVSQATVEETLAEVERARLKYESEIGGVNTTVATVQAELDQARYYLENTTMVAPEDGRVINLQVRAGMVAGIVRAGAIASFICDADRYLLATYNQESLKYVAVGQPVEVALDLYPGQIFPGTGRGHLEGEPHGTAAAERPPPHVRPDTAGPAAAPLRGADHLRRPESVAVPDRRPGDGGDLHRRPARRLGGATADRHPCLLVDELALSHSVLRKHEIRSTKPETNSNDRKGRKLETM